jgi:hypothetical protein
MSSTINRQDGDVLEPAAPSQLRHLVADSSVSALRQSCLLVGSSVSALRRRCLYWQQLHLNSPAKSSSPQKLRLSSPVTSPSRQQLCLSSPAMSPSCRQLRLPAAEATLCLHLRPSGRGPPRQTALRLRLSRHDDSGSQL